MKRCPVCGEDGNGWILSRVNLIYMSDFDLVECSSCGVICFDPLPTPEQLSVFYSASYYNFEKDREEGKGMAFARRLRRWKESGEFLDVGCATGFFINGIKKHSKWNVHGTDFGKSAAKFANEKLGLDVRHGDISDAGFDDASFDYVHVNNVLEHVLNPVSLLKECRRLVKPDGFFYLSVPNGFVDSRDLIDFYNIEKKPARSKNGHIFFFPSRTLMMLLEKVGFAIHKTKTYSLKRGLRSVGYLRRKKDWKKDYFPRESPEIQVSSEIEIPDEPQRHSNFYYKYRFLQGNLQMIPGLHEVGLDFLFIMKPKT
jgi:2-polyprenyl-3-methyl-5-hydroxy-6-metoxy-1,4-benzoquinol methylase